MSVFLADEQSLLVNAGALRGLVELVLAEEGLSLDTEVAVMLVSDEEMAGHNQRHLGREGPTDVLALPLENLVAGVPPRGSREGPPVTLGDVVVAPDYVSRQAAELEVSFEDELALMVVHGVLHLLGYDHDKEEDAAVMEDRERQLLGLVGRRRR